MCPIKYYTLMIKSKDPKFLRLHLIQYASEYGISAASRAFNVTRKTVYKWLRRHEKHGYSGLASLSPDQNIHLQKLLNI